MHPDLDTLFAYRDGDLEAGQARRIHRHLERCADCRLKIELGKWQLDHLPEPQANLSNAGDASARAEFLARVKTIRSSPAAINASLLPLLAGRGAVAAASQGLTGDRHWKTPMTTILAATILHFILGMISWCAWQFTGNPHWMAPYFHSAGDLLLLELSAVALYLNVQVWKGFEGNEPLQKGWFLIALSSASSVMGLLLSKLLATNENPLWASFTPKELGQIGLFLDGPVHQLLLLFGFCSILRAYHRAGVLRVPLNPGEWGLVLCLGLYTSCETVQAGLSIVSGRMSGLQDFANATSDPLLLLLLLAVISLNRSVRNLASENVGKAWVAFLVAICLISMGNIIEWATNSGHTNYQLGNLNWYISFVTIAAFAIAADFQLAAMGRTADFAGAGSVYGVPAAMR